MDTAFQYGSYTLYEEYYAPTRERSMGMVLAVREDLGAERQKGSTCYPFVGRRSTRDATLVTTRVVSRLYLDAYCLPITVTRAYQLEPDILRYLDHNDPFRVEPSGTPSEEEAA